MISKELLSEVLGYKTSVHKVIDAQVILTMENIKWHHSINIYELAHKCKEWADRQGYTLETTWYGTNVYQGETYKTRFYNDDGCINDIKACELVLEQKDKQ